ncbi:MAG TPA: indole-3-glycerol-phosphate synthase, partial [Longimicrobiales bacterium]|nr:indole-3-glycerol-phosphate synthase [Longimicrobiales bacterium]
DGATLDALEQQALATPRPPRFAAALTSGDNVAVIAEFKRRSPSAGALESAGEPGPAALLYAEHGAAALSVLTDAPDFDGSLADLRAAADAAPLPVLRKDFLVSRAELYRARGAGAAAALLIVAMLEPGELRDLLTAAAAVGLDCLTEVHDAAELDTALEAGADIIGINNRDLRSLNTDLVVAERLAPRVPGWITLVGESGIRSAGDVRRMRDAGCDAVLVGESLMRLDGERRARALRSLTSVPRNPR